MSFRAAVDLYTTGGAELVKQIFGTCSSPESSDLASNNTNTAQPFQPKIVVITGGSTGIGFETASALARMGHHVYLTCRNASDAKVAAQTIQTSLPKALIHSHELDLASKDNISSFVDWFVCQEHSLDVLICNAAVMLVPFNITDDMFELHFGVNCLGHFYLTWLLLPLLAARDRDISARDSDTAVRDNGAPRGSKRTTPSRARIINLASVAHVKGTLNNVEMLRPCKSAVDVENNSTTYSSHAAYCRSKLVIHLLTFAFARYFEKQNLPISIFAVNPGIVDTQLYRHVNCLLRSVQNVLAPYLFRPPKMAAHLVVLAACSDSFETTSGLYLEDGTASSRSSVLALDEHLQESAWLFCCDVVRQWGVKC